MGISLDDNGGRGQGRTPALKGTDQRRDSHYPIIHTIKKAWPTACHLKSLLKVLNIRFPGIFLFRGIEK